jgi:hypothetical protein
MPTTPQGTVAFYAAIRIGTLPALIHPLSTEVAPVLARARELAAAGRPVLVNVWLDKTGFREGSVSM